VIASAPSIAERRDRWQGAMAGASVATTQAPETPTAGSKNRDPPLALFLELD